MNFTCQSVFIMFILNKFKKSLLVINCHLLTSNFNVRFLAKWYQFIEFCNKSCYSYLPPRNEAIFFRRSWISLKKHCGSLSDTTIGRITWWLGIKYEKGRLWWVKSSVTVQEAGWSAKIPIKSTFSYIFDMTF